MLNSFSSIRRRKPLKIVCEAPAYEVVKASEEVGMRSPQDVRWRRQALPTGKAANRRSLLRRIWRLLFAFGVPEIEEACACGSTLPERSIVRLRKNNGPEVRYALAQCGRCRTIVWDEERTSAEPRPTNLRGHA